MAQPGRGPEARPIVALDPASALSGLSCHSAGARASFGSECARPRRPRRSNAKSVGCAHNLFAPILYSSIAAPEDGRTPGLLAKLTAGLDVEVLAMATPEFGALRHSN